MELFFKPVIYMVRGLESTKSDTIQEMTGTFETCAAWSNHCPIRKIVRLSDGMVVVKGGDTSRLEVNKEKE